jgi:hypothetical protein
MIALQCLNYYRSFIVLANDITIVIYDRKKFIVQATGLVIIQDTCFVRLKPTSPIRFQIMYLHPSVEDCRYVILQQLFAWQAVVTSQERIQSTRYQVRPQYF